MTRYSISQPVTQVEAPRLVSGKGRFTDDITLPQMAHGVFLRSPHAHADIVSIDTSAASAMPGVIAILTGADYEADGLGVVRGVSPLKRRDGSPMYRPPRPALISDRVRHVGQGVALVIAETINQGKDATEAIEVDYSPLPAHFSTAEANQGGVPQLYDDCLNNEPVHVNHGDADAVDAALAAAPHVLRETFVVNRVAGCTMEPRSVVGEYDEGRDHYTIHACHQRPYIWRQMMCDHVFHIPENKMTIIAGDVGGSYGMKGGLYPEVPLTAWAAKKTGRPVKWTCERSEALICDDQARDMHVEVALALEDDGTFTGVRLTSNNNVGAYVTMIGFISTNGIATTPCGVYRTPAAHGQASSVLTNTVPVSNYRAPGGVPGTYVIERIIDMAARQLGMDPAEIRRKNLIPADAMPYRLPTGGGYDCGEFEAVMDKCIAKADYAGAPARKEEARARGKLHGIGISTSVDPSAGPSPETAELRFDPGGSATIIVGSTAGGQSHETIYTQIISDRLGLEAETIEVVEGDTSRLSWGTGTGGARTATIAGTAVYKAVDKVIEKTTRIAAHLLEAAEADIEFADGTFTVAGTDRTVEFVEVAKTAFKPNQLPKDIEIGLYETATWSPDTGNVPNSCHICEVEIDPDTGITETIRYTSVHDVGVEINPLLVDGQVHGGIAQGVGQALMEDVAYDQDSGQILSGSFMDYCMPRASDFCNFDLDRHPVPTATNPMGVKGAGECGTVGAVAVMMNAINDALAPLGVRNLSMPATPEKVWQAIHNADGKAA
ncbi:MAG: xanthine dehydrogenase family protein molybdopterin-binding subunit [Rhodospirillaceae bacterium]|nr:xanthine dehydrogenase family protein molybdopterin-binding subunit [Rhodospirillaceae bacterium]MBT5458557.1 xanthine dehydrogenase family protein molybdopterin-binding subunit [Rhodospirillaceae bacterium]